MEGKYGPEKSIINLAEVEKTVALKIEELKQIPEIKKAFEMLDGLPDNLKYHAKAHTEDVLHETVLFAVLEGLAEDAIKTAAVAAAWHDTGYLIKQHDNEEDAVRLFTENAPDFERAKDISAMIMDTKVVITENGPEILMQHELSGPLLDADVSNFGRTDFREKADLMALESGIDMHDSKAKLQFLKSSLTFLRNHDWHTNTARSIRQAQKEVNIVALEQEIAALEDGRLVA